LVKNTEAVQIEVFTSGVCGRCKRACRVVELVLQEAPFAALTWRETDVVEQIDRAVAAGVLVTPTILIGGSVAFTSVPSASQLRRALTAFMNRKGMES